MTALEDFDIRRNVQAMQLISLALPVGVLMFAGIVVYLSLGGAVESSGGGAGDMETLLSLVHVAFFVLVLCVAPLGYRALFSDRRIGEILSGGEVSERVVLDLVQLYQKTHLLRLALFEGAALFGVVVCLLAALSGLLATEPIYWLNLGSAALFVLITVATFPTVGKVTAILDERIRNLP